MKSLGNCHFGPGIMTSLKGVMAPRIFVSVLFLALLAALLAGCSGADDSELIESCSSCSNDVGDFPTADGFVGYGSNTSGAADCPIGASEYVVTNLNDSGPGSFRDAVSEGCRTVTFAVGGTIEVNSTIQISDSYLTIDGSTAPEPGITLDMPEERLVLEASGGQAVHDIIVTHIRTVGNSVEAETKDMWELDGSSGAPIYNVVLDHLTMQGASDGAVDIYGDVHHVTLSNSLIWDTVKGQHYSQSGGERDAITVYRNVYAKNNERQPRIRYNTTRVDFVNNVIYGWGWFEGGAAGMHLEIGGSSYSPSANVENNIYHYVSGLNGNADDALVVDGTLYGDWYFNGNSWPNLENDADSTSDQVEVEGYAMVERLSISSLGDEVVPCAGTHFPTEEEIDLLREISIAVGGSGEECA